MCGCLTGTCRWRRSPLPRGGLASVAAIHHCGLTALRLVPEVLDGATAGGPIKCGGVPRLRSRRLQLDGRARQPWPLRRLRATQRLAFERAVERLLLGEDVVDDARELLRHD